MLYGVWVVFLFYALSSNVWIMWRFNWSFELGMPGVSHGFDDTAPRPISFILPPDLLYLGGCISCLYQLQGAAISTCSEYMVSSASSDAFLGLRAQFFFPFLGSSWDFGKESPGPPFCPGELMANRGTSQLLPAEAACPCPWGMDIIRVEINF